MSVHVEQNGPVTTVILSRPERRNAVDHDTAEALAEAFRAFDSDAHASVAVLWGEGGTFCAGAELKAVASGEGMNRLDPNTATARWGRRMHLSKPVIAAIAGYAVAGGLELASGATSASPNGQRIGRLLPALGAAHRRRHHPPAAANRHGKSAGSHPDRTRRDG